MLQSTEIESIRGKIQRGLELLASAAENCGHGAVALCEAGALLEEQLKRHPGNFPEWVQTNLPGISEGVARACVRYHRKRVRGDNPDQIVASAMREFDVLPAPPPAAKRTRLPGADDWLRRQVLTAVERAHVAVASVVKGDRSGWDAEALGMLKSRVKKLSELVGDFPSV